MEQTVWDSTQDLQDTVADVSAVVRNLAGGLEVFDEADKVIGYNPSLETMLRRGQDLRGVTTEQLLGNRAALFMERKRRKAESCRCDWDDFLEAFDICRAIAEFTAPRTDRTTPPIELSVSVLPQSFP